jgi:MFS family permease
VSALASSPGALRVFAVSIVARLPLAMLSIALLVHARHLTGSFAAAGLVAGAYAASLGVGGPLLGALVDRRGQTVVLLVGASVTAALLGVVALLPEGVAVPIPVLLAAAVGLATPPLGACVRTLLPYLLPDPSATRAAYAAESAAIELTWILGPPLALGLGAALSTGAALAFGGAVLLAGTAAFAAEPASRAWRPEPRRERPRGGSLRSPAIRTLVIVLLAAGVLFGAVEVGVAGATTALGNSAAAGPLLGIWGAGSLLGGLVATRLGGGARGAIGLTVTLAALTAGHFLLVAAAGSVLALAAALLVAGTAIAPTYASIYAMVDDVAPAGTVTEAFAWLTTAVAVGASAGVAVAGALAESAGPAAAFGLAGGAGLTGLLIAALRSGTLSAVPQPA